MTDENHEPETVNVPRDLPAFQAIMAALEPLPHEARLRVLKAVEILVGPDAKAKRGAT